MIEASTMKELKCTFFHKNILLINKIVVFFVVIGLCEISTMELFTEIVNE